MIDSFKGLDVEAAYGRVSKIIAIYLKTSVVINSDPSAEHLQFIHPPIDRTILKIFRFRYENSRKRSGLS